MYILAHHEFCDNISSALNNVLFDAFEILCNVLDSVTDEYNYVNVII